LRIGSIIAAHTVAACLGAVTLASTAAVLYARLHSDQRRFGVDSAVSRDVLRVEDSLHSWLVMGDLVYGSGETYLAEGLARQSSLVLRLCEQVAGAPLGAEGRAPLYEIERLVRRDQGRIQRAARPGAATASATGALLAEWDADAQAVPALMAQVSERVHAATRAAEASLERRRHGLIRWSIAGGVFYLALVAMAWLWVTRTLVWPLGRLSQAAERAVHEGVHVDLGQGGPVEVRRLSVSLQALVHDLEATISTRTADLVDRERHLLAEIEARRASEEAAQRAQRLAEAASQAKSEFLARMSHEVRTPLHGILGVTSLMEGASLDPGVRSHVRIVQESGQHLLNVVNDVLDFAKASAGRLVLRPRPFHLTEALRELAGVYLRETERKHLSFSIDADPWIPSHLIGDELRLRQILTNLLANAVKFTAAGGIRLTVRAATASSNSVRVRFAVTDTGIGVPVEERERIFESFSQVEHGPCRRFGGTGLGLAIAKSLVTEMGGTIGIDAAVGQGSTFWFEVPLPLAPVAVVDVGLPAPHPPEHRFDARVLLVEDNPINALVAREMLALLGCQVIVAEDGSAAVTELSRQRYDLVLMDLHMPVMDGLTAARLVRAREWESKSERTPIVALTADILPSDVTRCLSADMDAHAGKPFKLESLQGLLERFCPNRRVPSTDGADPSPFGDTGPPRSAGDRPN
jgi:signal transduction histidine kinase